LKKRSITISITRRLEAVYKAVIQNVSQEEQLKHIPEVYWRLFEAGNFIVYKDRQRHIYE